MYYKKIKPDCEIGEGSGTKATSPKCLAPSSIAKRFFSMLLRLVQLRSQQLFHLLNVNFIPEMIVPEIT